MSIIRVLSALFLSACLAVVVNAETDSQGKKSTLLLDLDASHISFTSVKAGQLAESHYFKDFYGVVSPEGKAQIYISAASIFSLYPRRDQRIREHLFEVDLFPKIQITADVPSILEKDMPLIEKFDITVNMHGVTEELELHAYIQKTESGVVTVATVEPIIVPAYKFNYLEGIKRLSAAVNNIEIAPVAPVTFALTFKPVAR